MALTPPTADLTGNTIADTYDQLLILDNADGIVENTLKIVSTQLGRSALQLDDEKVLIKGVDTSNAAAFEVQQTGGTSIFKVATGTPALTINAATVTLTQDTNFVLTGGLNGMAIDGTTFSVDGANNRVGIGTATPSESLHVYKAGNCTLHISSDNGDDAGIYLGDAGGGAVESGRYASITWDGGDDALYIGTAAGGTALALDETGKVGIGTVAPNTLLELDQGASDVAILTFTSSDINHLMVTRIATDSYGHILKTHATNGGLTIGGFSSASIGLVLEGTITADTSTRSTSGVAPIYLNGLLKTSLTSGGQASDKNLLAVANNGSVQFIVDTDGDLFANAGGGDVTNGTEVSIFDAYDDAQLARAIDLSRSDGANVINGKFDEFVEYNHEKLADLNLVGREEDGTPNHFINVTGMQRLHNGAIWQQYTEMQKMKELMYETMVELMGKDKADKKLDSHDIKLLDKDLLS